MLAISMAMAMAMAIAIRLQFDCDCNSIAMCWNDSFLGIIYRQQQQKTTATTSTMGQGIAAAIKIKGASVVRWFGGATHYTCACV